MDLGSELGFGALVVKSCENEMHPCGRLSFWKVSGSSSQGKNPKGKLG